jgi:hypothetical protein
MTMYVDILSSALDEWVEELSGDALVEYALTCREEMLRAGPHIGDSAYASLASEIAYDRALITLCIANGISAAATSFTFPHAERLRVEAALANVGFDLAALSRRHSIEKIRDTPVNSDQQQ